LRGGYAQNWQVSLQRDLPGSLVMTATYLGIKGTRTQQQFLPLDRGVRDWVRPMRSGWLDLSMQTIVRSQQPE